MIQLKHNFKKNYIFIIETNRLAQDSAGKSGSIERRIDVVLDCSLALKNKTIEHHLTIPLIKAFKIRV